MGHVEDADYDSLSISSVQGTRLQSKLGPHIDTFLASLVLTEAAGHMQDEPSENRLAAALDKVLVKIQKNQGADGMWGGRGWAPALANAMAVKGLNRARQAGMSVREDVLVKAESDAVGQVTGGGIFADPGSAGIPLYAGAKNLGVLQDSVNSNRQRAREVRDKAANAPTAGERKMAEAELARFAATEAAYDAAQRSIIERLDDDRFIAGFGSNGGEEFLSHMNIGESLVVKGGDAWKKWDAKMTANMNRVQNSDGSWTGHHCITSPVFCTAAVVQTLNVANDKDLLRRIAKQDQAIVKTDTK